MGNTAAASEKQRHTHPVHTRWGTDCCSFNRQTALSFRARCLSADPASQAEPSGADMPLRYSYDTTTRLTQCQSFVAAALLRRYRWKITPEGNSQDWDGSEVGMPFF
ncbi:unnamed protein product [Pylaiella littoralis]